MTPVARPESTPTPMVTMIGRAQRRDNGVGRVGQPRDRVRDEEIVLVAPDPDDRPVDPGWLGSKAASAAAAPRGRALASQCVPAWGRHRTVGRLDPGHPASFATNPSGG